MESKGSRGAWGVRGEDRGRKHRRKGGKSPCEGLKRGSGKRVDFILPHGKTNRRLERGEVYPPAQVVSEKEKLKIWDTLNSSRPSYRERES